MKKQLNKVAALSAIMFLPVAAFAQDAATVAVSAAQSGKPAATLNLNPNAALMIIAVALLVLIVWLYKIFNVAALRFKKSNVSKTLLILLGTVLSVYSLHAQDAQQSVAPTAFDLFTARNLVTWLLLFTVLIEVGVVFALVAGIRKLAGIEVERKVETPSAPSRSIWDRVNAFKPISHEGDIDTGHNYDGIRELDNITPPWFTAAFLASIVFGIIYMVRYHVTNSAPLMIEEYTQQMAEAAKAKPVNTSSVDENSVELLGENDIQMGKVLYEKNCAVCHGNKGEGNVGPNLTDEYWLHKGSIKDVFYSIKYGWVEKGMKAWKDDFSPDQIAQLASFVTTMKGTNPPNAKEPQGELYTEVMVSPGDTTQAETPTDTTVK